MRRRLSLLCPRAVIPNSGEVPNSFVNILNTADSFLRRMYIFKNIFLFSFRESFGASLVVQTVKNAPAMQETWVWFLGWEDPPEDGMATHSSIIAWRIPMDRGAWWATVLGVARVNMTEWLSTAQPRKSEVLSIPCLSVYVRVLSRVRLLHLLDIS